MPTDSDTDATDKTFVIAECRGRRLCRAYPTGTVSFTKGARLILTEIWRGSIKVRGTMFDVAVCAHGRVGLILTREPIDTDSKGSAGK